MRNGQPLGVVDLDLMLDNRNQVVIAPGRPALLQLDFDLAASHEVDISTVPAIATAQPFIVATIEPVEDKDLRVRGPLVSVDTNASSYVIDLRPFNDPTSRLGTLHRPYGRSTTAFEIDGVEYEGAAGLATLAGKAAGTPTVAAGVLDVSERSFTASDVLAGDSVPGARFDVVVGNVIARAGDTLTVRGGTVIRRDGTVRFLRGDIDVLLGPNTIVTRDGGGRNLLRPDRDLGRPAHPCLRRCDGNPDCGFADARCDRRPRAHEADAPHGQRGLGEPGPGQPRPVLDRRPPARDLRLRRHGHFRRDRRRPAQL